MLYLSYAIYVLILIAGCVIVNKECKENDLFGVWTGIIFIVSMFVAITHTLKNQQDPIIIQEEGPHRIIELDFGTVGITAWKDEKTSVVYVVSCFQGEGDNVTDCWDSRFVKDDSE